jgi:hypothetical protein
MAIYKFLLCLTWVIAIQAFASTEDQQKEIINGVSVKSHKDDSTRTYMGEVTKSIPANLETVFKSIVNFDEKCNNAHKDRRKNTSKSTDCRYHNENVVETLILKKINLTGWTKEPKEVDRYLLARRVYNRADFQYYELVRIYEDKNDKNQKTIKIVQTMMTDKEVNSYTKPLFEKDSAFNAVTSTYFLTEIESKKTELRYEYKADTEHWILNKEVSVPQVFSSISKGINDLLKAVDSESNKISRELASN